MDLTFLTLADAATALQISKRTVSRLIKQKKIPALKVGTQWRIRESEFKKWVEKSENAVRR
jgi:excisionase family DNA binding protein